MRGIMARLLAVLAGLVLLALMPRAAVASVDYWVKLEASVVRASESASGETIRFQGRVLKDLVVPTHNDAIQPPEYSAFTSGTTIAMAVKGYVDDSGQFQLTGTTYFNYTLRIADSFVRGQRPDPTAPIIGAPLSDSERDDFSGEDVTVRWSPWFWIRVGVPSERPVAANQVVATQPGMRIRIDLTHGATGGQATAATLVAPSSPNGEIELEGLEAVYLPSPDFTGDIRFQFQLSNSLGSSNLASVVVYVMPELPIAANQNVIVSPSAGASIDLQEGATGGEADRAWLVSTPPASKGVLEFYEPFTAIFLPASGFMGETSFAFVLSNYAGLSNIATVHISVALPLEVHTLNPFWTYPSGAASIDLSKIGREIDSPGSSPGVNPSGFPLATKIVSDGVSRIIIGLRTSSRARATISLSPDSPGGLMPLTSSLFRTRGVTQRSIGLTSFAAVPGGGGALTGGVVYVAPETLPNSWARRPVTLRIEQAGQTRTVTLDLMAPPVLLLHDLWSGPAAWAAWGGLPRSFPIIDEARYDPAGLAFDAPALQASLKTKIDAVLEATRRKGIVAAQVNLVGHGMGGLVARVHANDNSRRGPQNFGAGPVNAVVTIDTPHQGTPLAQRLQDSRNRRVTFAAQAVAAQPSVFLLKAALSTLANPTLSDYFARVLHKPISGASESLRPGSASLTRLRNAATQFPYEAISIYDDVQVASELEFVLGTFLRALGLPSIDQILGPQNDAVVGLASQRAGGNPAPAPFPGLVHAGGSPSSPIAVLNSPVVAGYVMCRLLNKTGCREAAASEPAVARVPVDSFSLSGLRRIADSNLALSGIPAAGLVPNFARALTPASSSSARRLTHYLALIDNGDANWFSGDNVDPKIRITATSLKPITVRMVGVFSDRSYASRSFTLRPYTGFAIRSLVFDDPVIRIKSGTSYPLALTAWLDPPAAGSLDVTAGSLFTSQPTSAGIARVSAAGIVTAVAPGTMSITGSFRGRSATATIIVGP